MSEKLEPTYIGKNDGLVFKSPKELFTMSMGDMMDRERAKKFSKYIRGTFKGFQIAKKTKLGNENNTERETSPEFWDNFEKKAKDLGADLIGYTPVDENYVFKNLKIYGKNAIVLGMEMKWDKIKTAPSVFCGMEAFRVYQELGDKTIELTNYLKDEGYNIIKMIRYNTSDQKNEHTPLLGQNIKCGNSLINDEEIAGDKAFKWEDEFKEIIKAGAGAEYEIKN